MRSYDMLHTIILQFSFNFVNEQYCWCIEHWLQMPYVTPSVLEYILDFSRQIKKAIKCLSCPSLSWSSYMRLIAMYLVGSAA